VLGLILTHMQEPNRTLLIPTEYFKQQVRILIKDYPHIKRDLRELHKMLKENPKSGKSLGRKAYKIRLKSLEEITKYRNAVNGETLDMYSGYFDLSDIISVTANAMFIDGLLCKILGS
ncbi:MAG: hypothetical protein ACE5GM_11205, partial [bacterium]